jgi:hypothetical protein
MDIERVIRGVMEPSRLIRVLWRKIPIGPFSLRMKYDVFTKTQYAFGIYHAAKLAKALRIREISCIEFGVASGQGLLHMENAAKEVSREVGIKIQLYGFDLLTGLPEIRGYKDQPYVWKSGFYKLDYEHLKERLPTAKLVIGDVKDTIKTFRGQYNPAPIGFISFDLDLYSSTAAAFELFSTECEILPRVICYFDDILDAPEATAMFNDWTGELLAIKEFNETHETMKLAKINGLYENRYVRAAWPSAIYVLHSFKHPRYNDLIWD